MGNISSQKTRRRGERERGGGGGEISHLGQHLRSHRAREVVQKLVGGA